MYFIADDNGDVWAHDIDTYEHAQAVLADWLATHSEDEKLNPEILSDDKEING